MADDGDFTFPTTVATTTTTTTTTVPKERDDVETVAPPAAGIPGSAGASRLWPFAAPPIAQATTAAAVMEEEEDEAPVASTRKDKEEDVDHEDRMDMLWDDTATAAKPTSASSAKKGSGRAEPHPCPAAAKPAADERAAEQESMDQLWESFNEEVLLLRRARSKAAAAAAQKQRGVLVAAPGSLPEPDCWYLCPSSSTSDAESEEASSRYGCAPTMLRASSRAGGAGQFCSSSGNRRRRSRGGGWALLLRFFRRLFAVDKAAAPRRHGIHHVP